MSSFLDTASVSSAGSSWVITSVHSGFGSHSEFPKGLPSPIITSTNSLGSSNLFQNDEDLTVTSDSAYWQEEAHWMSFHNAVTAIAQRGTKATKRHRTPEHRRKAGHTMLNPKKIAEEASPCKQWHENAKELEEDGDNLDETSLEELFADLALTSRERGSLSPRTNHQMLQDCIQRIAEAKEGVATLQKISDSLRGTPDHARHQKALLQASRRLAQEEAERDALEGAALHRPDVLNGSGSVSSING